MSVLIALAIVCMVSLAAAPGIARADDVQDILALTGLNDQLEQIPALIQAGLTSHQSKHQSLSPEEFGRLTQSVARAYSHHALSQSIRNHVKKEYDADRFTTLQFLLRSPIARKMSQLEHHASTNNDASPIIAYTDYLTSHPPDQERLRLVRNLHKVDKMEELSVHLQALTLMATLQAFDAAGPTEHRLTKRQLSNLSQDIKRQLQESLDNVAAVVYLYTYRTVSDEELGQYIQLRQSRTITWFQAMLKTAISEAMASAAGTVEAEMAGGNTKEPI